MKTTELIAEILVIGVGTLFWMVLLIAALYPQVQDVLASLGTFLILPGMAFVYVLGIITDKCAELSFSRFVPNKYGDMSSEEIVEWKIQRDKVLIKNEYFQILHLSYISRKKILRGWTLNFVGLAIAAFLYMTLRDCETCDIRINALVSALLSVLAGACFFLWRSMDRTQKKTIDRLILMNG